jgi:hypothetical protein
MVGRSVRAADSTFRTKDGPRTHRATNVGPTPFHNISFIFKKPGPAGNSVSDRTGVVGFAQIMDRTRVRAWRPMMAISSGGMPAKPAGSRTPAQRGLNSLGCRFVRHTKTADSANRYDMKRVSFRWFAFTPSSFSPVLLALVPRAALAVCLDGNPPVPMDVGANYLVFLSPSNGEPASVDYCGNSGLVSKKQAAVDAVKQLSRQRR